MDRGQVDRSTRENYETLHFVTAIGEVEGKTLFVSGRCVGRVTYSNIPCDAQLYHEVHGALKEDHGGGFFTSQTTQVIVAFRRGDEHMQQSPQGDLFSAPPEPLGRAVRARSLRRRTLSGHLQTPYLVVKNELLILYIVANFSTGADS